MILVTGVAGFIGWKTTESLLKGGHQVLGLDNMNNAYDVRLKPWRLAQLEGKPGFEFHQVDICDRAGLRELFNSKFDAVINLAARAGVRASVENPWVYFETNVTGTLNLLELCRRFGVKKFVLSSTSSIYGTNPMPFKEDQPTDGPLSPYAASKKAAEALCHTYHYLYGLDITVLRYFTVYGPAGRPDMSIFRFIKQIAKGQPITVYGDGTQTRDFTYVDDIAEGTLRALRPVGYQVINLGNDHPVELNHVIRQIEACLGKAARIEHQPKHPADVPATWADIGKAKAILGWKPIVRIEEGIERTVAWYRENQSWARALRF